MQRLISSLWDTDTVKFQVTFVSFAKWCIGVTVLCIRPLTHDGSLWCKTEIHLQHAFSFFFLHCDENAWRGWTRVRTFRHTRSTMGASIARKRTGLGPRVLRHQLAQTCPTSCIMTCFFFFYALRWSSDTQSVLVHFLPKLCLWIRDSCDHDWVFRRAIPQCGLLHVLLFLCTLGGINKAATPILGSHAHSRQPRPF